MENSQRLSYPRLPYKGEFLGVIVGMLLGDGCICKSNIEKLIICHGEKQKDYFDWKCKILESFGYKMFKVRSQISGFGDGSNGKKYKKFIVDFYDKRNSWFYRKFYINGKRKITYQLIRHLNQYGLAIWFMDDGNNAMSKKKSGKNPEGIKYNYYCLNTQGYSYEENVIIQKILKKRFNLVSSIQKSKGYFKLYFGAKNGGAITLANLVRPYIHPMFEYKLEYRDTLNAVKSEDIVQNQFKN